MTPELKHEAEAIGKEWGSQEVALWRDQHDDGDPMPEWTMGTYCGRLPNAPADLSDDLDLIIDKAAREVWEAAR